MKKAGLRIAKIYNILYILPVLSLFLFPNVYFTIFGIEPNPNPPLNEAIFNIIGGVIFLFCWIIIIYLVEIFLWNLSPLNINDNE